MKIAGLVDALNLLTDIPFTEWAWSEAPADGYGVVTADGQSELKADADPAAEKMLTGYVDVFIKATDPDPTEDVEDAMRAIGVWFRMESIQFEPETGFIHIEWRYTDSMAKATKAINLEEIPIVLHIAGTEEVTGTGGQTYRKVTFKSGEAEKLFDGRNTRDMIVHLQAWDKSPETVYEVLRKYEVIEIGALTEVRLETGLQPVKLADSVQDATVAAFEAYEIDVYFNNGVFHSAVATHFVSA